MSQLKINQDRCIGCGLCISLASKTFAFSTETNKALVIQENTSPDSEEVINQAVSSCPVGAITKE